MSFTNWKEAIASLEKAIGPVSKQQLQLASFIGIPLQKKTPKLLAAALLKTAVYQEIDIASPLGLKDHQRARIKVLKRSQDFDFSPSSDIEGEALIKYLRLVRRCEHLRKLRIQKGDIVETKTGVVAEVSSIGEDGRIYFTGGKGAGAWPDLISVRSRLGDSSIRAQEARRQAENTAALRVNRTRWSEAKSHDLREFATSARLVADDIVELESVIERADDEKPIQEFLEEHRHLLTALLGGKHRFCLPQKRLGGEYVPDFIIGDVNSLGVRWILVELETPKSKVYTKYGRSLHKAASKGVNQILEWRNWLAENISYARKRRSENGLGLFDIREKTSAIVLVGRRILLPETKDAQRREFRESNNIEIHTYDWLLESLRGQSSYDGLPAASPFALRNEE